MGTRIGRFLALAIVITLCTSPAFAQSEKSGVSASANFAYKYDVESTTFTYCKTAGSGGDPFGSAFTGVGTIVAATSTTVTTVDTSGAFAAVNVGDIIYVNGETRVVVTNADDDTITVDTALTLTGNVWSYRTMSCGTAVTDGWINTSNASTVQLTAQYDAGDLTTLAVVFECKEGITGSQPVQVYPGPSSECGFGTLATNVCEFSTVGDRLAFKITDNVFTACRVGLAYVTADGGTADEVTATIALGR